mmetsp:Transcript_8689/g.26967  ORF Transcript_8689/g.26967 Transcript_8689/m.26967 type:complete len:257 (+) Transcript_8689:2370-3140(+)
MYTARGGRRSVVHVAAESLCAQVTDVRESADHTHGNVLGGLDGTREIGLLGGGDRSRICVTRHRLAVRVGQPTSTQRDDICHGRGRHHVGPVVGGQIEVQAHSYRIVSVDLITDRHHEETRAGVGGQHFRAKAQTEHKVASHHREEPHRVVGKLALEIVISTEHRQNWSSSGQWSFLLLGWCRIHRFWHIGRRQEAGTLDRATVPGDELRGLGETTNIPGLKAVVIGDHECQTTCTFSYAYRCVCRRWWVIVVKVQ